MTDTAHFTTLVPDEQATGGWWIDHWRLTHVVAFELKLKYPLVIKYRTTRDRTHGTHNTPYHKRMSHLITLAQWLPINDANDTLWHELTHAVQSEVWEERGYPIESFYDITYKERAGNSLDTEYSNNDYEVHCREMEERYRHIPLLRNF